MFWSKKWKFKKSEWEADKKKKSKHLVYISWILETAKNVGLLAVKCMFTNETSQHPLELLSCLPLLAEVGVFLVSSETTFQSVI